MRILHTEWSDGWGGQEIRVVSEMSGLTGRAHNLTLVTRKECRVALAASEARIPLSYLPMRRAFDPGSILRLRHALKRDRVQVVNTHSGVDSWIGSVAARLAGTPVLLRTRHVNIPIKKHALNFVHDLPDCIITCGESIRRTLIDAGFAPQRVVNIPTGIDFEKFAAKRDRNEMRASLGVSAGTFMILMVGILRRVKAHEIALAAVSNLKKSFPQIKLVIAGDGPQNPNLKKAANEMGIQDSVQFLGFRNDIPDLLNAADMFLLTSYSEGVPQSATQALGMGLPVVASNVGGVPELIEHQRTGLLFPAGDAAAAAEQIAAVLTAPDQARERGKSGQRQIHQFFSREVMVSKVERLCTDLLAGKTAKRERRA
jgi:glycosyltransferase involved in cell wall biosynthesis